MAKHRASIEHTIDRAAVDRATVMAMAKTRIVCDGPNKHAVLYEVYDGGRLVWRQQVTITPKSWPRRRVVAMEQDRQLRLVVGL